MVFFIQILYCLIAFQMNILHWKNEWWKQSSSYLHWIYFVFVFQMITSLHFSFLPCVIILFFFNLESSKLSDINNFITINYISSFISVSKKFLFSLLNLFIIIIFIIIIFQSFYHWIRKYMQRLQSFLMLLVFCCCQNLIFFSSFFLFCLNFLSMLIYMITIFNSIWWFNDDQKDIVVL